MPYFPPPAAAGAGTIANLDAEYEYLFGASGVGIPVTSGGANAYGSASATLGTTTADWDEFEVFIAPSNGNHRYMVNLSFDGGSTWTRVFNRYARPGLDGSSGMWVQIPTPMNVPSGSDIRAQGRCPTGAVVANVGVRGRKRSAQSRPSFDNMEMIIAIGSTTQPSAVSVTMTSSLVWTELVAATSRAYGAIQAAIGEPTVAPAANKKGSLFLAVGGSGSEVIVGGHGDPWLAATSNPLMRSPPYSVIKKAIASGQRISACLLTDTPNTDAVVVGLTGFY